MHARVCCVPFFCEVPCGPAAPSGESLRARLPSALSLGARLSGGLLGVSAVLDLTHSVLRASLLPSLLHVGPTMGAVPREGGAMFIRGAAGSRSRSLEGPDWQDQGRGPAGRDPGQGRRP